MNRQQIALLPLYESRTASPDIGHGVVRPGVTSRFEASRHQRAFISMVRTEWQFDLTQDDYSLLKWFININGLQLAMLSIDRQDGPLLPFEGGRGNGERKGKGRFKWPTQNRSSS